MQLKALCFSQNFEISGSVCLKVKIKFALDQARKAHRRSRDNALFNLGARLGWVVNATSRPLYPHERDPVTVVPEAGWAPGADLDGRGKPRRHSDSIPGPSSQ